MKVVVTDYIEKDLAWEAEQFKAAGIEFAAFQLKGKSDDEIAAACADAEGILVNMVKVTDALLDKLPNCKLIVRHGIGYDNVDVAACTRHGVQFAYQPDYCKDDVAEHAIALMFACARKVVWSRPVLDASSAAGQWDLAPVFPLYRLHGKTLGIVGVGRIGSRVYRKLRSFGFRLLANDPYLTPERKAELEGLEFVDKETLFSSADFVTVHVPLNDETRHLVDAEALGWMKPTAYLVNTARGPVVDEQALAEALKKRQIAGAGVDVYPVEPPPPDFPLLGLDNAILTPHIAWASEESSQEIRQSMLNDFLALAQGKPARCVVNPEVLDTGC